MNKTNDFKFNLPAYSDPVDVEDLNDNFRGIDDALMAGLCKKDYTGNNMGSSDPSARKYAWAPWLEIVNDNEFDVVVTDRNAPVESEEATINIAAGQTFRKYINGRYYMNFYVQDQHDVTFKWFTNAETYINESGGGGGGTGTVTSVSVQGGSGSHLTGSGNPIETSGTITINVDEGYSIPSDNEQDAWDAKAVDLKFEINSSTFVITAQLKDSSGNLIGNERTIDLPLESVVVSGDYDEQTKKVILTLQNGSTIEFSVADLVSGLQTELNSNNKLNPEYIAYDASHRAVSDTEKGTWNAKQNAISDLETIRSGASAGATAVQPSAMQTALSTKQDSLDSTQLAAVNSGINSTKVAQISTNQSNILYALQTGVKNILDFANLKFKTQGSTVFTKTDTYITTTSTNGWASTAYEMELPAGTYVFSANISDLSIGSGGAAKIVLDSDAGGRGTRVATIAITQNGAVNGEFTWGGGTLYIMYYPNYSSNVVTTTFTASNNMICTKAAWDQEPNVYRPFALPNSDLTYLEAEDRAALAEEIDSGAKNKWANGTSGTVSGWRGTFQIGQTLKKGTYIIYFDSLTSTDTDADTCQIIAFNGTTQVSNFAQCPRGNKVYTILEISADANAIWIYASNSSGTGDGDTATFTNGMICTKAAFGVSQKFVPYCKLSKIVANLTKTITTSATLDATGLQYTFSADASKHYRVTAWAKANGKNPETIAIATTSDALLGYSAFPTDTTNACISTSCIINTGSSATIDVKVKYNGVGSNHYIGMIVEEL